MLIELQLELLKLVRKPRTYIGPAAMGILTGLILVGMKYGHQFDYMRDRLEHDFYIAGSFVNAAFLTRFLLEGIVFTFLPLFACMVCGDIVASEAADGTLRTLLCRPVTRLGILGAKYIVAVIYVLALVFGTGLVAYLLGAAVLGRGSLVILSQGVWVLPEHTAILRLAAAYALVAAGMVAVGSIAFAVSTFLSNSNGAIVSAMGFLYGSAIIGEIEFFARLKPYLLTTHLDIWRRFFTDTLDVSKLAQSVGVMLIYSAAAFLAGAIIFQRRDVLS